MTPQMMVLTGGFFRNEYLVNLTESYLKWSGRDVFICAADSVRSYSR